MAIITDVPGLEISITIDNIALTEYKDGGDEAMQTSKQTAVFVESQPGSCFKIQYRFDDDLPFKHDDINIKIRVDGVKIRGLVLGTDDRKKRPSGSRSHVSYYEGSDDLGCNLTFADSKIEEDSVNENVANVEELGVIIVSCLRCIKGKGKHTRSTNLPKLGTAMPEKQLKGLSLSHQASLGEPRKVGRHKSYKPRYLFGKVPFATFNFKYRSKQALQSLRLVPDTPSPSPSPEPDPAQEIERAVGGMTREELEEFCRTRMASETQNAKIKTEVKRERSENGDDGRESSQRPRKAYRTSYDANVGREVVDLSFDD